MNFEISSLRCAKYIEKKPTPYQEGIRNQKDLKSSFHKYLPRELTVFLVKKDCKIKYGFEDSISNIDLGLTQPPNNQLMFSFVTLWFC